MPKCHARNYLHELGELMEKSNEVSGVQIRLGMDETVPQVNNLALAVIGKPPTATATSAIATGQRHVHVCGMHLHADTDGGAVATDAGGTAR